jgi:hypothetical protein
MAIPKAAARLRETLARLPDPFALLRGFGAPRR